MTTELRNASGKDFSPLPAARWITTATSLVAAMQSPTERRLPRITSIRAPLLLTAISASIFARSLVGLTKQRRLQNPRFRRLLRTWGPINPFAPVISIRSPRLIMNLSEGVVSFGAVSWIAGFIFVYSRSAAQGGVVRD